jgi:hypothetical protein
MFQIHVHILSFYMNIVSHVVKTKSSSMWWSNFYWNVRNKDTEKIKRFFSLVFPDAVHVELTKIIRLSSWYNSELLLQLTNSGWIRDPQMPFILFKYYKMCFTYEGNNLCVCQPPSHEHFVIWSLSSNGVKQHTVHKETVLDGAWFYYKHWQYIIFSSTGTWTDLSTRRSTERT